MTLPALIIAFIITSLAWAAYAFPAVLSLTADVIQACQSLFVRCVELASIAKLFFIWSGALLVSIGLIYAAFRAGVNMLKVRKAISEFPVKQSGKDIALIMDGNLKTAFTCGLLSPRIYISTGLINSLEKDELRAVFLHELKHKKSYDPLRFLIIGFAKDAFFYLPAVKHLAMFARLKKEHEADDMAAMRLGQPVSLASAMIKVAREGALYAALADNTEQVAGRVRRLLEGRQAALKVPSKAVAISLIVSTALLLSLSMPIYAGTGAHECTLEKCETHVNMVEGCRAHCSTRHKHNHNH
jgi:Zn-dependent protease with chaperone function